MIELPPLKDRSRTLHALVEGRLWLKVLIGLTLGVATGVALGPPAGFLEPPTAQTVGAWLALPVNLFIRLVQMIMVPLVVSSGGAGDRRRRQPRSAPAYGAEHRRILPGHHRRQRDHRRSAGQPDPAGSAHRRGRAWRGAHRVCRRGAAGGDHSGGFRGHALLSWRRRGHPRDHPHRRRRAPVARVALLISVDNLLGMCRTTANVMGDLTAALVFDRAERERQAVDTGAPTA
ncbi:MAG: cation:dicarboxylase symporter family transporter [Deltaproteobacteria bacterium]|nr:cation:dicarboxylase symporter family transporter [Deltaproteobacteria bacterium]